MKKLIPAVISMLLLLSPANAKEEGQSVPLRLGIQEAHAETLDDGENHKPKKKKAVKHHKKAKKAKKTSGRN